MKRLVVALCLMVLCIPALVSAQPKSLRICINFDSGFDNTKVQVWLDGETIFNDTISTGTKGYAKEHCVNTTTGPHEIRFLLANKPSTLRIAWEDRFLALAVSITADGQTFSISKGAQLYH